MTIISRLAVCFLATAALTPLSAHAYEGTDKASIWNSFDQPRMTQQQYFTTFDADRSGSLDQKEYAALSKQGHATSQFHALDINRDGKLSLAELEGIESQRMAGN